MVYFEEVNSYSIELLDYVDSLDFLFSEAFLLKWKHKYSEDFIRVFRLKILKSLQEIKPIKRETLKNFLKIKTKFNEEIIFEFFEDIDLNLYLP